MGNQCWFVFVLFIYELSLICKDRETTKCKSIYFKNNSSHIQIMSIFVNLKKSLETIYKNKN